MGKSPRTSASWHAVDDEKGGLLRCHCLGRHELCSCATHSLRSRRRRRSSRPPPSSRSNAGRELACAAGRRARRGWWSGRARPSGAAACSGKPDTAPRQGIEGASSATASAAITRLDACGLADGVEEHVECVVHVRTRLATETSAGGGRRRAAIDRGGTGVKTGSTQVGRAATASGGIGKPNGGASGAPSASV